MKTKPVRLISLLIALLLVFSAAAVLSSCANGGEGDDTTAPQALTNSDVTTAPEETELVSKTLPAGLDYGGETIVIISRDTDGVRDEFLATDIMGDIINDAVFSRNKVVEKLLNVTIDARLSDGGGAYVITDALVAAQQSGDHLYDIISNSTYSTIDQTVKGIFCNLKDCDYLDLTAPYWSQGYNAATSIGSGQYLTTGAISLSMYRYMFVTFFNQTLFEQKGQASLFDAVDSGEWTLDYQLGLLDVFYDDLNGNGQADEGDCFGFASNWSVYIDPYWSSCDLTILSKNQDNWFEITIDLDRLSNAVDKILDLYYAHGSFIPPDAPTDAEVQGYMTKIFSESRAATCTMRLLTVETNELKSMNDLYGIIPMPKLNGEQEEYYTFMHDQLSGVGIPFSDGDERLQKVGAVLEALAVESARTLVPAYYEIALKGKFLRSSRSAMMMDRIYDSVRIDGGVLYYNSLNRIHSTLRGIIGGGTNTVASSFKSSVKVAEKNLEKLQNSFREMQNG